MWFGSRTGRSLLVVGLLASACVVAGSPRASADPTWLSVVEVTSGSLSASSMDVDHLPDGTVAVVWTESVEVNDNRVFFATRAPGVPGFSPREQLSEGGAYHPQLEVDAHGAITVAWRSSDETVRVTRREPGATQWSTPPETVTVSTVEDFQLVAGADGAVTVVSRHTEFEPGGKVYSVNASTLTPGGSWSLPQVVVAETRERVTDLEAAADRAGNVSVVWVQGARMRAASREDGVFVQTPLGGGDVDVAGAPDVATMPGGGVAVSWARSVASSSMEVVVATRSPGGSFADPLPVADPHDEVIDTEVVVDASDTITVLYAARTGAAYAMVAATRPARGSFTARTLAVPGDGILRGALGLALAPDGALTTVWQSETPAGTWIVQGAHRAPGGEFGEVSDLTPAAPGNDDGTALQRLPKVSVDTAGDATVVWRGATGGNGSYGVRSRILDTTGPRLTDLDVPPSATAGSRVVMTVSAVDAWSGPTTLAWSLGDGATATGATTSHTYAAAGSYVVRVTATDGAGNTTSMTRTISVDPAGHDTTAPVLTGARLMPGRLPTGEGARLRLTSSERAALSGVVQRRRDGRWRAVGTKRWSVSAGANDRTFYGKTSEQRLRSGKYRVRLTATDPAGNTSATTTLRFRVDRAR